MSPKSPKLKLGRSYQKGDAMMLLRGILASRLIKKKDKPTEEALKTP
jgi:hypothetical protein